MSDVTAWSREELADWLEGVLNCGLKDERFIEAARRLREDGARISGFYRESGRMKAEVDELAAQARAAKAELAAVRDGFDFAISSPGSILNEAERLLRERAVRRVAFIDSTVSISGVKTCRPGGQQVSPVESYGRGGSLADAYEALGADSRGTILVIVNGKAHETIEGNAATYEHIVHVAGMTGHPSMTVSWPDCRVQSGCILSAGESIALRDGMRISVQHTGNA